MTSYLINAAGTELIATIRATLPSGVPVRYSRIKTNEVIDASREFNLVNAQKGKISNAAKWSSPAVQQRHMSSNDGEMMTAIEINPGEFYVS